MKALATLPDIPETTTVALLKIVVTATQNPTLSAATVVPDSLPAPMPSLTDFLTAFLESPSTPSTLRNALQRQLTALEVIPVLRVLDGWLAWWAARGGGGGALQPDATKSRSKRLAVDPFSALAGEDADKMDVDQVVPPPVELVRSTVTLCRRVFFVTHPEFFHRYCRLSKLF